MPKLPKTPSYRKHRASGQAIVCLSGKDHYLGPHGTKASRIEYDRMIGQWLANGRRLSDVTVEDHGGYTMTELVAAFVRERVKGYYLKPNGKATSEVHSFKSALAPLIRLFGETEAAKFGPRALVVVRDEMIRGGWNRRTINKQIARLKLLFKWGVSKELIPSSVYGAVRTLEALKAGRTEARESAPVLPVPIEFVDAIRPHLSRQVEALIDLQLLTAARPGELVIMRPIDIDTSGKVWVYKPSHHKTEHHGHSRSIYLGPKAQDVVRPFLKLSDDEPRPVGAFVFSPAEAVAEWREKRTKQRATPLSCGNKIGSNRKRNPKRRPGRAFTTGSYCRAIRYACEAAWPVPAGLNPDAEKQWRREHSWHPHQLRHNAATNLRKEFGLDVAANMLGHRRCDVTQVYAEKNHEAAMQVAERVG